MNLDRPGTALIANLIFVWVLSNYFPGPDLEGGGRRTRVLVVVRVLAVLLTSWTISGWSEGWVIAVPLAFAAATLLVVRSKVSSRYLAELELANIVVMIGTAWTVGRFSLSLHPLIQLPASRNAVPATLLIVSILCYSLRGGSFIVRGFLEKGALIPAAWRSVAVAVSDEDRVRHGLTGAPPATTEGDQVRHGRLIGYLERIVIIAAVTAGSFEALGFLMAAKGLIRAKEFDDRAFAEYFLVGSLCSALIALVAGLMTRAIVGTVEPGGLLDVLR